MSLSKSVCFSVVSHRTHSHPPRSQARHVVPALIPDVASSPPPAPTQPRSHLLPFCIATTFIPATITSSPVSFIKVQLT